MCVCVCVRVRACTRVQVLSHRDGRQYAVKRSVHRFRGSRERTWSVREARNHERLGPHPHILAFIAAWEEGDRLHIQTELCCTNLQLYAENQPANIGLYITVKRSN